MNLIKNGKNIIRRKQIIDLIHSGTSIPKISKQLGVYRSTIYYHYKKIKGRKYPLVKIPNNDMVIGEFLGAFAGDGSFFYDKKIGHYTISIHLHATDDKDYGFYLKDIIEKNFNKKVRVYFKQKNELQLVFYSKRIFELIDENLTINGNKTLNVSVKKPLNSLSKSFISNFIKGLIDTDGCLNKNGQIVLALISKRIISQVSNRLTSWGIENKVTIRKKRPNEHELYELKMLKTATQKYIKLIGFSNKRKLKNAPAEI